MHMLVVLQLTLTASAAAKQPECNLLILCQVQYCTGYYVVVDPFVSASNDLMHAMYLTTFLMVPKLVNDDTAHGV